MKKTTLAFLLLTSGIVLSQTREVGVSTELPKSTLDANGKIDSRGNSLKINNTSSPKNIDSLVGFDNKSKAVLLDNRNLRIKPVLPIQIKLDSEYYIRLGKNDTELLNNFSNQKQNYISDIPLDNDLNKVKEEIKKIHNSQIIFFDPNDYERMRPKIKN